MIEIIFLLLLALFLIFIVVYIGIELHNASDSFYSFVENNAITKLYRKIKSKL